MTKLQRTIIILIAFGVVSIVLSQTNARYADKKNISQPQQANSVNAVNLAKIHIEEGQLQNEKTPIVTNIYQTQSGSFFFHHAINEQGQREYTPSVLKKTDAQINITGPIARTRLTQVFVNNSDVEKSGIYVFPLPQDAAVDALLMQIGDRRIEGEIKRKAKAQKMFNDAKAQGKKASLVSQLRPNMFSNQIANIPPHSEISVTIEYQQYIKQDKYNYALRLPLSITPRYFPEDAIKNVNTHAPNLPQINTNTSVGASLNTPNVPTLLDAETNITVRLNTGLPITQITSEHHPIKTFNPYSTEYEIELDTDDVVNKDFVLNWQMQMGQKIQASHFNYQADDHEYGLITLMPPMQDKVNPKRNLVFILDVSGSMVGEAIEQAKQALALAIEDLGEQDYFNLITFSSESSRMWPQSQIASQAYKEEALSYLYGVEANGGTEIKKALNMAFDLPLVTDSPELNSGSDYLNQLLFITDGSVGNENELMQLIYQKLGSYRLFTVGIGSAPNAFFMQEAAIAGKGTFTFIGDISTVKPKMIALLEKIKRPALTNIQLNIKDAHEAFGFEVYPSILPDLYTGEPLVISYKRKLGSQSAEQAIPFSIKGQYLSNTASGQLKNRQWASQLPSVSVARKQGIHKYWAKMKIQDLHRQLNMRQPFSEGYENLQSNIEEGITKVALEHQLVSKYTSLIAIDHSLMHATNKNASAKNHAQLANNRLLQTASPSLQYLVIALCLMLLAGLIASTKAYSRFLVKKCGHQ